MNDDFLRRTWRRPPAAFEKELRERLRQQEFAPPPLRRTNWGLLIVSILVGSAALAAVTYLTTKHFSTLGSSASETKLMPAAISQDASPPQLAAHGSTASNVRDNAFSPDGSSSGLPPSGSNPTMSSAPTAAAMVRITITPEFATLAKEISTSARYKSSARAELANADAALQALCTESSMRPDVVIISRPINRQDLANCNQASAGPVMEAKLGHMATVISRAKIGIAMQLSADTLLRALLKRVPSSEAPHRLIDNPYTDWNQIDASLDSQRIEVLGPPRESAEFLVFAATILEPACDKYSWLRELRGDDPSAYEQICYTLRDDGVYESAPLDNNFVRQRLWADPAIVAIVDYPFYSANSADLVGSLLTGPAPTAASIVNGSYAGARPVNLYVTRVRYLRTPAVKAFVDEYLRRQDFAQPRWMTTPDGSTDRWQRYRPVQLIEARLDEPKEQP
jgi:phosphate transport system substrate-binding protein